MADVRLRRVATGFAVAALLTSVIAVIVVVRRAPADVTASPPAAAAGAAAAAVDSNARGVAATDVLKLKRDVVEKADGGVRITDEPLRAVFGLDREDVITAINGRTIARDFDVFDAVLGASTMNASILYLEVTRAGASRVIRYEIEGELRTARRDTTSSGRKPNPFTDPLLGSVKRTGPLRFEIPRTTIEAYLANPDTFTRQARAVSANGLKLFAVRPGSIWATLGFESGDTLRSVNGRDPATPDLYAQLKDATELQILVVRRTGLEDTIVITIP